MKQQVDIAGFFVAMFALFVFVCWMMTISAILVPEGLLMGEVWWYIFFLAGPVAHIFWYITMRIVSHYW